MISATARIESPFQSFSRISSMKRPLLAHIDIFELRVAALAHSEGRGLSLGQVGRQQYRAGEITQSWPLVSYLSSVLGKEKSPPCVHFDIFKPWGHGDCNFLRHWPAHRPSFAAKSQTRPKRSSWPLDRFPSSISSTLANPEAVYCDI